MLDLAGNLELRLGDGTRAHIVAHGSTLELEIPRARDLRQAGGRLLLQALAPRLAALGLTLRVVSRGRTILVAGRDATPGPLSRMLLGSPAAELRLGQAIWRRRR